MRSLTARGHRPRMKGRITRHASVCWLKKSDWVYIEVWSILQNNWFPCSAPWISLIICMETHWSGIGLSDNQISVNHVISLWMLSLPCLVNIEPNFMWNNVSLKFLRDSVHLGASYIKSNNIFVINNCSLCIRLLKTLNLNKAVNSVLVFLVAVPVCLTPSIKQINHLQVRGWVCFIARYYTVINRDVTCLHCNK